MEKIIPNNQKLWNLAFSILGFSPLVFIICLIAFYINMCLILDNWNISSMNPNNLDTHNIFQGTLIYSYLISFFGFFVWLITVLIYLSKNKKEIIWKPIIITLLLYSILIISANSKIMEFALE